jgi:PPOX class probable FMN-dependent enzyme
VSGMLDDAHVITSQADLWAIVGEPVERVLLKELPAFSERASAFVASSPFLLLATAAADGTCDVSPKGGPPGFARVLDDHRLVIPEFPGNRRLDGVHNLVERPGVATLFVVPGITETLRVNGFATLTRDPALLELTAVDGRAPWFVVDVRVAQVFSHCSKAFLRSYLWQPERWPDAGAVRSPSISIAEAAAREARTEADVRREAERGYLPELY